MHDCALQLIPFAQPLHPAQPFPDLASRTHFLIAKKNATASKRLIITVATILSTSYLSLKI
jgi:hypothetical protein